MGSAQSVDANPTESSPEKSLESKPSPPPPPQLPPPKNAKPFPAGVGLWVDRKKESVYVDGVVSLRRGVLEMFACPRGTKEHESVVAVHSRAYLVHAALLSIGAKPGRPVQFVPEYCPPEGDEISIAVQWLGSDGKLRSASAQSWVRDIRTNQPMKEVWVFAGSGFWKDKETSKQHYMAEAGDLICVSNFSTATLDVPDESPQANEGLLFEAYTERIPPLGTPVRLALKRQSHPLDAATEE